MSTTSDIFPNPDDPATAPFWEGTRQGRIVMQTCTGCGYVRWPPAPLCPECWSSGTDWKEVSPTGTVYSYATYRRAMSAETAKDVPYTVVLVELDNCAHIYGRLAENTPIAPGMRVRAVFPEIGPELYFVGWKVDGSDSAA